MATTKSKLLKTWNTLHQNGPFDLKLLYQTKLEGERIMPNKTDRYNDVALEIQKLIKETQLAREGFRAYGSAWSMNNIASHKDRMHYNGFMNISMPIHAVIAIKIINMTRATYFYLNVEILLKKYLKP